MSSSIELIGSVKYDRDVARPRNFSRQGVLEKALPVFCNHDFSDASLQELEKATGVNKSGQHFLPFAHRCRHWRTAGRRSLFRRATTPHALEKTHSTPMDYI